VAQEQGDSEAAKAYHERALAIVERLAPDSAGVARCLGNLALTELGEGNVAAAKAYHQRALAIFEKAAPDSLEVARCLGSLGRVAYVEGELAAAAEYYRRALAIEERLAPDSLAVAGSLSSLGDLAHNQGEYAAAKRYYERAFAIQEKLAPDSLAAATSLNDLSDIAHHQADRDAGEHLARRAWEIVRRQAAAVTGDEARQAFGAATAHYGASLVHALIALGRSDEAFVTLEESRAQALQQLLLERPLTEGVGDSGLWSEYRAAAAARDRAEQAASQTSIAAALARRDLATAQEERRSTEEVAPKQAALDMATKRLDESQVAYVRARVKSEEAWAALKESAPRVLAEPLPPREAARALPRGTLFIAFSVGGEHTYAFLLRGGSGDAPLAFVYHIARRQLQEEVDDLRLRVADSSARWIAAARDLFGKLFPPEAQKAIREAKRLLISPDGPLWEVPFAVLVTNARGAPRCLGTEKPITYTQSLTLFAQARRDARPLDQGGKPVAVVVGDPVFVRAAGMPQTAGAAPAGGGAEQAVDVAQQAASLPTGGERTSLLGGAVPAPLPATRDEASSIARLYSRAPLLGEGATEAALRQQIGTADVIHLATHGFLHPFRPMSSGVLLTVPEKETGAPPEEWSGETVDDGVLQAWEICSQLKLRAEVVVLSACETGRGENVRGEGIVGMTRALQYAGARAIVASQWQVADESTRRLMVAFHQKLREGLSKDEALREAMAVVRQDAKTAHPYYWAPFFLIGDPENPVLGGG
jgi:CHAT domain-containing protein